MKNRFDQLAKQILELFLLKAGPVKVQQEVPAEAEWIDVWFPADPLDQDALPQLGLIGKLASGPSLFEPFSRTPGLREVRGCLTKLYAWHERMCKNASLGTEPGLPRLWVISPGVPEGVINALGPTIFWENEPGVCQLGREAWGLHVLVLPWLPEGRRTLPLRLMGRGAVLQQAIAELSLLPADAWEKLPLQRFLVKTRVMLEQSEGNLTAEERETIMILEKTFEEWEQAVFQRGAEDGAKKGQIALRNSLHALYEKRFGEMPSRLMERIEEAKNLDLLQEWLLWIGTESQAEIYRLILGE